MGDRKTKFADRGSVKKARLKKNSFVSQPKFDAKTLPIRSATPGLIVTKAKFSNVISYLLSCFQH